MTKYEIMYILDSTLDEETRKLEIEKLHGILTENDAKLTNVSEWGNRELAYEINKQKRGYYVVVTVETENPEVVSEFTRLIKINKNVLRYIVIKL